MAEKRKRGVGRGVAALIGLILKVVATVLLIGIMTSAILICFAAAYIKSNVLPYTELDLRDYNVNLTSTIYCLDPETGEYIPLQDLYGEENRTWVDYKEIPRYLEQAAVAIEDERFYKHRGVDWKRTGFAFVNMFLGMRSNFGGSTITQQLVRNVTGDKENTVERKIMEIFRALEFDRTHSKEDQIEWYLNYIFLGQQCHGVYSASYAYFGKHVSELSLAECAALIGITNNPSMYDPYINRDGNKNRQKLILYKMLELGYITKRQHDAAVAEELQFVRAENEGPQTNVYTWYVDQVINDVISDLAVARNVDQRIAARMVYNGGYQIFCNMDPQAQAAVDAIYQDLENLPYVSSATGKQLQSAISVIDPKTGYVVALSGGMGEKTGSRDWNRATASKRPPGSSIKPLSVYAPALEMGLIGTNTVVDDSPYSVEGGTLWPVNVDNAYAGLTTIYNAVRVSKNTVAVKVLDRVTPTAAFEFLGNRFDINLVIQKVIGGQVFSDIGYAQLALGGLTNGVSTLEMAAAYAAFANEGVYTKPTTYSRVLDSEGAEILSNVPYSSVVLRESTVYYMNQMLEGVVNAGSGTGARLPDMTVAGKTGTTTSKRDTWFVGYTPYYVAAVWVGYDIQERINLSVNQAPIMWKKVMEQLHAELPNEKFPAPTNLVSVQYCLDCGQAATSACTLDPRGNRVASGTFIRGDQPVGACACHVEVDICYNTRDVDGIQYEYFGYANPYCGDHAKHVALVDYDRVPVALPDGKTATIGDSRYLKSFYDQFGLCTVHSERGHLPWETPEEQQPEEQWPNTGTEEPPPPFLPETEDEPDASGGWEEPEEDDEPEPDGYGPLPGGTA